jgi:hypothetical protein
VKPLHLHGMRKGWFVQLVPGSHSVWIVMYQHHVVGSVRKTYTPNGVQGWLALDVNGDVLHPILPAQRVRVKGSKLWRTRNGAAIRIAGESGLPQ